MAARIPPLRHPISVKPDVTSRVTFVNFCRTYWKGMSREQCEDVWMEWVEENAETSADDLMDQLASQEAEEYFNPREFPCDPSHRQDENFFFTAYYSQKPGVDIATAMYNRKGKKLWAPYYGRTALCRLDYLHFVHDCNKLNSVTLDADTAWHVWAGIVLNDFCFESEANRGEALAQAESPRARAYWHGDNPFSENFGKRKRPRASDLTLEEPPLKRPRGPCVCEECDKGIACRGCKKIEKHLREAKLVRNHAVKSPDVLCGTRPCLDEREPRYKPRGQDISRLRWKIGRSSLRRVKNARSTSPRKDEEQSDDASVGTGGGRQSPDTEGLDWLAQRWAPSPEHFQSPEYQQEGESDADFLERLEGLGRAEGNLESSPNRDADADGEEVAGASWDAWDPGSSEDPYLASFITTTTEPNTPQGSPDPSEEPFPGLYNAGHDDEEDDGDLPQLPKSTHRGVGGGRQCSPCDNLAVCGDSTGRSSPAEETGDKNELRQEDPIAGDSEGDALGRIASLSSGTAFEGDGHIPASEDHRPQESRPEKGRLAESPRCDGAGHAGYLETTDNVVTIEEDDLVMPDAPLNHIVSGTESMAARIASLFASQDPLCLEMWFGYMTN
ncbi:MAG: hypothetical protein M1825_002135 [Sarcosagium campestre]|nr:MAG: hypothetical protein M1825_002135 [Sarcosagium campestre]